MDQNIFTQTGNNSQQIQKQNNFYIQNQNIKEKRNIDINFDVETGGITDSITNLSLIIFTRIQADEKIEFNFTLDNKSFTECNYDKFNPQEIKTISNVSNEIKKFIDSEIQNYNKYKRISHNKVKNYFKDLNLHLSEVDDKYIMTNDLLDSIIEYICSLECLIHNCSKKLKNYLYNLNFDLNYEEMKYKTTINDLIEYISSRYKLIDFTGVKEIYNDLDYRIIKYYIKNKGYKLDGLKKFIIDYNLSSTVYQYVFKYKWKPYSIANICEIKCIENNSYNNNDISVYYNWAGLFIQIVNENDVVIVNSNYYDFNNLLDDF